MSLGTHQILRAAMALLLVGLGSTVHATQTLMSCDVRTGCVSTTGCSEKNQSYHLVASNGVVHLVGTEGEFLFELKEAAKGPRVLLAAAGSDPEGIGGAQSLTVFDTLSFVFTTHVLIESDKTTHEETALSVTLLGTCEQETT